LLFSGVTSIIEGIYIFLSGNYRYIRVFKLLAHLNVKAYLAILPRGLYYYNLLLLKGPSCLKATAFYQVFIEFLFKLSRGFKKEMVNVNKRYK